MLKAGCLPYVVRKQSSSFIRVFILLFYFFRFQSHRPNTKVESLASIAEQLKRHNPGVFASASGGLGRRFQSSSKAPEQSGTCKFFMLTFKTVGSLMSFTESKISAPLHISVMS